MSAQLRSTGSVDEEFMNRWFEVWARKEIDNILAMCTEDVTLESSFGPEYCGKRFVGKAAVRDGIFRYWAMAKQSKVTDRNVVLRGDTGFVETTIAYPDFDGKSATVKVCDVYDFRGGKIASKRAYTKRIIPD